MADASSPLTWAHLPCLVELLNGGKLDARADLQRLGMVPLWQVEQDLQLLGRYVPKREVRRAYRKLLKNPGQFIQAAYEIRVAAMLVPFADKPLLEPGSGKGKCDLKCELAGQEVFLEVTAYEDRFPPVFEENVMENAPFYGRVTVESSFDPTSAGKDAMVRSIPRSQQLRQRIVEETSQLPSGKPGILVIGTPGGHSLHVEWALGGDEIHRANSKGEWWRERLPNGLFCIPADVGGTSRLSALIWMKLVPHFQDVRVHSRLFTNPRAACRLSPETEVAFRRIFDRRAVLLRELDRIKKMLLDRYAPERIIFFGSLADRSPDGVHQWSDIDLAIVKSSPLPFLERIREVMDLLESPVGLNVVVYTPEEFKQAEQEGNFFVRDEVVKKGRVLFPS